MKLFIFKPYRFFACASLFITGMMISSCKKQFSNQAASDAVALNDIQAGFASSLSTAAVGTLQVITVPNAIFNGTAAVVTDVAGNIYIADSASHVIRKINTVGVAYVFAGTINNANLTDGQGAVARFNKPVGLAIDAAGNLYVADKGNHAVRKITPDSVVTTLAGTGSSGTTEGPGSIAQFTLPSGVAVDAAGNVYVADAGNNKIRRIRPDAQHAVGTFAGNGTQGHSDDVNGFAQFYHPTGVAVNVSGTTVYVADAGNNKIRIIAGGETNTLAGGGMTGDAPGFSEGTGSAALFNKPVSVAVDAAQNVYVADKNNNRIRQINSAGSVSTVAGTGAADFLDGVPSVAKFNGPSSVFVNAFGNIFVADAANIRVRQIGVIATVSTFRLVTNLYQPSGIAIDPSGNIYVSDFMSAIHKITPNGTETVFAGSLGGFQDGPGSTARFSFPDDLASDAAGNIYVCDALNNAIRKITPSGMVSTINPNRGWTFNGQVTDGPLATATFNFPYGIAVGATGNIFIMDGTTRVRKITPEGMVTTIAGSGASGFADGQGAAAQFNQATGIAVDANDTVYVADYFNNRIRKVSPTGLVTTIAGSSTRGYADGPVATALFSSPYAITVDAARNIFVCDRNNNRLRKISPAGMVSTIAGSGDGSFGGYAEGLAPYARFGWPVGMVINNSGAMFVADCFNRRVRKIQ
jgi:sugar lactone lactonase YvrE